MHTTRSYLRLLALAFGACLLISGCSPRHSWGGGGGGNHGGNVGNNALIWNDAVTASGLIWNGDGCGLFSTTGTVTNDAAVWGGGGHH